MKRSVFAIILLIIVGSVFGQNCNCNHVITAQQTNIDAATLNIQPGDTICLQASEKKYLRLMNFHGTPDNYIVFINCGGAVVVRNDDMNYGLKVGNSSYFRLTGSGSADYQYGIKVMGTKSGANGLSVDEKSTNFELDHVEVANTGFAGIMSKTDPKCDFSTNRDSFTQYQTVIHDNYIHNTGGEGMYIGHSFYSGWTTTCDGVSTVLSPGVLKGVRIYNNVVDSAHWDGIQVGSAPEDCEIYGNRITNFGVDAVYAQCNGIQIGGGTTGKCYNNFIANGSGCGIIVFGVGNNDFYNNVIVNAGYNNFPGDSTKRIHGILCDDRSTIAGSSFNFYNNTIVSPKTDGIRFMSTQSAQNKFYNNLIVRPGSLHSYSKYSKESPFINIGSKAGVDAVLASNYFASDVSDVGFVDAQNLNFRLAANSPVIRQGMNLINYGIQLDFDSRLRPLSGAFDIGAFEYEATNSVISIGQQNLIANLFPNPCSGRFNVECKDSPTFQLTIYDSLGNELFQRKSTEKISEFDLRKFLVAGLYCVRVTGVSSSQVLKMIVQ